MNLRFLFILWAMVLGSLYGSAIEPFQIDTAKIHQEIKLIGDEGVYTSFHHDFFRSIVFKNDSIVFYNPNGTLHLYLIQLGKTPCVTKLSKSKFHGHNFQRFLFLHKNIVYSYGGEGLFNVNPNLIYFDTNSGEWFKREIKNYPLDTRGVTNSCLVGDSLRVILNHNTEYDENAAHAYTKHSCGYVDLDEFEYHERLELSNSHHSEFEIPEPDFFYQSDRFDLFGYKNTQGVCVYSILDKRSGDFFMTPALVNLSCVNGLNYHFIVYARLFSRDNNGKVDSFDINSMTRLGVRNLFNGKNGESHSPYQYIILTITLSILFLIWLLYWWMKKNPPASEEQDILEIENCLRLLKGSQIGKEELDQALGISHYSYETIKQKRSVLLNEINLRGVLTITRRKKQEDKRSYEYFIWK